MDTPYLLFLGDAPDRLAVKSARGVLDWRPGSCLGQIRLEGCKADLGLPDMAVAEAANAGAKTMIIGIAKAGGVIPDNWTETIVAALDAGMDVAVPVDCVKDWPPATVVVCPDQARVPDADGDATRFAESARERNGGSVQTALRVVGPVVSAGRDRE